ncbi:hypothetical+protein [Methylocapsa aurea]|uniref:general secretion pathway protein GspK n=1 Tax=Methylocapsa aurea TaxID=663610 RepID=UPI003D18B3E7
MGFALLVVIWGLGVISLLVASFASSSRLRLRSAYDVAGALRAKLVADGAVDVAILTLLAETAAREPAALHDGAPFFCALDGAAVAITTEDEGGKVDINAAPHDLLETMLAGLGIEIRRAAIVADAIVDFRTPPTHEIGLATSRADAADRPFSPKHAPFESVLEIDQVAGVDPPLFRALIPYVTIDRRGLSSAHRIKQGVDPLVTPPALFAALAGISREEVRALMNTPFPNRLDRDDPRFRPAFRAPSARRTFLIRAESFLSTGQAAVSETLIELHSDGGSQPYVVRESRHGAARNVGRLRVMVENNAATAPNCWSHFFGWSDF